MEGWDGRSAGETWTQFHPGRRMGSASDRMLTPGLANPDRRAPSTSNLLVDIGFDSPDNDLMTAAPARDKMVSEVGSNQGENGPTQGHESHFRALPVQHPQSVGPGIPTMGALWEDSPSPVVLLHGARSAPALRKYYPVTARNDNEPQGTGPFNPSSEPEYLPRNGMAAYYQPDPIVAQTDRGRQYPTYNGLQRCRVLPAESNLQGAMDGQLESSGNYQPSLPRNIPGDSFIEDYPGPAFIDQPAESRANNVEGDHLINFK